MQTSDTELKDDLLWGAEAIAQEIGRAVRITYHLLERGELPARKVCGRWVTTRTNLRKHLAGEE